MSPLTFRVLFNIAGNSLATDTTYVQQKLAAYINVLVGLGVAGLRLDAAKRQLYSVSWLCIDADIFQI